MNTEIANQIVEFENIIKQIKDVVSAKIVADDRGEIQEVHVLAGQNRGPKQLVRDIESAVMAKFGVAIDHKKISVAQMQMGNTEEPISEVRPQLVSAELELIGVAAKATVKLRVGEDEFEAAISGPNSVNNRLRLVAQASLNALEKSVRGTCSFAVEDVILVHMARQQAAIVSVTLVTDIGEESLIGSAFVRTNESEAIVKATLNAVNRRLSIVARY